MIFKFHPLDIQKAQTKLFEYVHGKNCQFVVEIKRAKVKRSLNQNRYYWGVVLPILSDHFGYTENEMHQVMTSEFLKYEKNGGQFVKSTTELSTVEFEQYMEQIRVWSATEHAIHIPVPNEITEEMYMKLQNNYNY